MVRYILGGVTLAATGYGLKRYFEDEKVINEFLDNSKEENNNEEEGRHFFVDLGDDEPSSDIKEPQDRFRSTKNELFRTSLRELQTVLCEIKNYEKEVFSPLYTASTDKYPFTEISDEVKEELEKFTTILQKTQNFLEPQLDKLDALLLKSNDYTSYSEDEQKFIKDLIELENLIVEATQSKITFDGKTFARGVKRCFAKIEKLIFEEN
ncbi:MAG TPA: hypothetical protein CFH79_03705 [Sulfurospirillum sp. UBA11407]|nr:MAG TPA: hypothetical protein CFH79_03705 [Sulfurospirillum sp. UBA11407]